MGTIILYIAKSGRTHYTEWLGKLVVKTRAIIVDHVGRLSLGIGEVRYLGDKLWELKVRYGPGYRVYYTKEGEQVILVYAGSGKSDQKRTIQLVRRLIKERETDKR